jgi:hypothetical protein
LLGSPEVNSRKPVVVSVGPADGQPYQLSDAKRPNLNLIIYRRKWALVSLIGLLLVFLLFLKYGRKDLLRDSGPPNPPPGKLKPYSLAKVQVAWWFFLIMGCFLLIYMITGQFTVSEQALILMGIGTGTALGSAMIDANKRSNSDSELNTLKPERDKLKVEVDELTASVDTLTKKASRTTQEDELLKSNKIELAEKLAKLKVTDAKIVDAAAGLEKPVSEGFVKDLLTDSNGVGFHRFQMIAWTLILGLLFLAGVYKDLAMPEFSTTMLALMGISAGTYLGFKIPEKQG